jgi:predicted acylesterase/phospholipase RssA
VYLNSVRLPALLGREAAEFLESRCGPWAPAWLHERAGDRRAIVLEADPTLTPWTRYCLAHADRVLLVADGAEDSASVVGEAALRGAAPCDLVLWHDAALRSPQGTGRQLDRWPVVVHHHLRAGAQGDMERLARHLSGHAVGLVLGGGAARAFAHVGALRALRDAAVPIDAVGGTSAGAVLAAQYAMGWDLGAMEAWCREIARGARRLRDFRLPLFSLLRGRALDALLGDLFGTTQIEDLWLPYYCVSSNLTRAAMVAHRRGSLRQYTRASCALPGLLPPVRDHGDLLVDGAVLNNLPLEPMRDLCAGGPIVAVDVSVQYPLEPARTSQQSVGLVPLLRRSAELASVRNRLTAAATADLYVAPAVADVGLLEARAIDRLIESGYRAAASAIAAWEAAHPGESLSAPRHYDDVIAQSEGER